MRTLNDVIDDLGFGWAQVRLLVLGGGIYWVDGTVTVLMSTLPATIARELSLHPYQRALLLSSFLVGKLTGNYSNIINDSYLGRRTPILIGYGLALTFALFATFAYSSWLLSAYFCVAGFAFGLASPAWNTLSTEWSPVNKRMLMGGISQSWFCFAALAVLLTEYSYSTTLHFDGVWRGFMRMLLIPGLLLFTAALFVGFVESAHVHLAQGKFDKVREVLEYVRQQNGKPDVDITFDQLENHGPARGLSMGSAAALLFGPKLWGITSVACWTTFMLNFAGYGVMYALPIVLPTLSLKLSAATILLIHPCIDVLGYAVAMTASNAMGRRTMMVTYLFAGIVINMSLCLGLRTLDANPATTWAQMLILCSALVVPLVMAPGWLVVYVYTTEVFPTQCRSFANGFVLGCGRLGSVIAPFMFEHLFLQTDSHMVFFAVVCAGMLLNAVLVYAVLPETKGTSLEECLSPMFGKGDVFSPVLAGKGEREPLSAKSPWARQVSA